MTKLFEGEWITLSQALIWLKSGKDPLTYKDQTALGEWDDVTQPDYSEARKSLLLNLRRERIVAKGYLDVYPEGHLKFDPSDFLPEPEWDRFFETVRKQDGTFEIFPFDECAIPGQLWKAKFTDWNRGDLWNNQGLFIQGCFGSITINKSQLLGCGRAEFQVGDSIHMTPRTGRTPHYDWSSFYVEIVVRADLDSLPNKQATLIRDMQLWCQKHWGEEPSESLIKEKIALIYRHPRKAGK